MNEIFNFAFENLGMSLEGTVLLLMLVGSLIFFAVDFSIGSVMLFVFSGGVFMWFYSTGLEYNKVLFVFFIALILMSFNLYAAYKSQSKGVYV